MILSRVKTAFPLLFAAGLVTGVAVVLVSGQGFDAQVLLRLSPGWVLAAFALTLVPWVADTARLAIWSRCLGHELPWRSLFRVVLGTELGSAVSPTAVGGAPVKVALLAEARVPLSNGIALSLLKTLEDGLFFVVALPLAFYLSGPGTFPGLGALAESIRIRLETLQISPWWTLLPLAVVSLAIWVRRPSRIGIRVRGALKEIRSAVPLLLAGGWQRFTLSFLLTALQWAARYSVVTALALGLGVVEVEPLRYWVLQWVVFTGMTMVPTPGATGGAEAGFALAYAGVVPRAQLGWLTVGWRVFTFYLLLGLGALLFFLLSRRFPTRAADSRNGGGGGP